MLTGTKVMNGRIQLCSVWQCAHVITGKRPCSDRWEFGESQTAFTASLCRRLYCSIRSVRDPQHTIPRALHSPDLGFSVDCAGCFVHALMPSAHENVKFRVFVSSLARAYFSVCGYASGDAYFSIQSPVMAVQTRNSMENSMLLM